MLILTSPESVTDADLYPQKNVEVKGCAMHGGSVDLRAVLEELGRREINNLMLEAGARLSGSMLAQGLVDELVVYMAPDLLGDASRGMFGIPGIETMQDKQRLRFREVRQIGRDVRLVLDVERRDR